MKSSMMFASACAIFAGVVALGPKAGHAAPARSSSEAAKGHGLFVAQGCYLCHGGVGQGAPGVGAALVPLRLDDPAFRHYVRAPAGSMPRYDPAILPDADLLAIAAYLRALPPPKPIKVIALLAPYANGSAAHHPAESSDIAAGRRLYARNCAGCHGGDREGGAGPDLRNEGQKRDAGAVARLLAAPPPGMPKLVPQPISETEANAIAAFVVSR